MSKDDTPSNDAFDPESEAAEERIEVVRALLEKRAKKSVIKRALKAKYGIQFRMAENYITEAKNRLAKEVLATRNEHVSDAYAFYNSIIRNESLPLRERLRAQENIDKLLGLHSPVKVAATDAKGNDLPAATTGDRIIELANRLLDRG